MKIEYKKEFNESIEFVCKILDAAMNFVENDNERSGEIHLALSHLHSLIDFEDDGN